MQLRGWVNAPEQPATRGFYESVFGRSAEGKLHTQRAGRISVSRRSRHKLFCGRLRSKTSSSSVSFKPTVFPVGVVRVQYEGRDVACRVGWHRQP